MKRSVTDKEKLFLKGLTDKELKVVRHAYRIIYLHFKQAANNHRSDMVYEGETLGEADPERAECFEEAAQLIWDHYLSKSYLGWRNWPIINGKWKRKGLL